MTSRGWRATQETKPLRLPAIKSDAGIFQDFNRYCLEVYKRYSCDDSRA
jgi:hypothetical protein